MVSYENIISTLRKIMFRKKRIWILKSVNRMNFFHLKGVRHGNFFKKSIFFTFQKVHISEKLPESFIE